MLLMVEKGIGGGMCSVIRTYAKANNKYMKYCEEDREWSCIQYWDENNLYGWAMSQNYL